ncbi:MAG: response regulator [Myxococcota bacterium]
MVAARDGFLPTSFSVAAVRMSRLAFGASRQLTALGRLAVGPAAMGHPLALGVSQTLATCTRAAAALVEGGVDPRQLARRYAREGVAELIDAATTGARALKWLRRARARAPKVFARAQKSEAHSPSGSGVLGLLSPSPRRVLACARSAGLWESVRSALLTPAPLNVSPVPAEPNLVYVVDDDAEVCQALSRYLEERGAEVVSFSDELALFAAVARRPPAAVVIDVVLSWVDGLRLCEGLKHHPLTCGVRVLVTSGLDRPHVRARALAAGAEAFFPKPIDASVLWAVLTGTCAVDATLKVNRGPTRGALRGFPPAGHPSPS